MPWHCDCSKNTDAGVVAKEPGCSLQITNNQDGSYQGSTCSENGCGAGRYCVLMSKDVEDKVNGEKLYLWCECQPLPDENSPNAVRAQTAEQTCAKRAAQQAQ